MQNDTKYQKAKWLAGMLLLLILLAANVYVAYAHSSPPYYHWHITGKTTAHSVRIGIYNALCSSQTCINWRNGVNAAKADGYNRVSMLDNTGSFVHANNSLHVYGTTTISGCGGFFPNTSSNHLWDGHVAFSTNNTCYSYQAIACQEIGHGWGFDHSPTGDCMAFGYYTPSSQYYSTHTDSDFTNLYYNHK